MLGLVVVVAGAAYVVRLRKKSDVEVANFDFHPDMDSSGSHIFSRFRRSVSGLFQRNEYIRRHRLAKYQKTSAKSYGAVEELWWLESFLSCWRERKYIYVVLIVLFHYDVVDNYLVHEVIQTMVLSYTSKCDISVRIYCEWCNTGQCKHVTLSTYIP